MNKPVNNLFHSIPEKLPQEIVETILKAPALRIERIISKGHCSAAAFWYDQEQHEWVLVLQGEARLQLEGGKLITLKAGDFLNIPAHQKHRVEWTTPGTETIWLALFY